MTINDIINGPEGAENPSKQQNVGIQMPANNSYQQSLYIAAISQYMGCEGLASPATDVRDGIEYTFDFYHPECGNVFKVLKSDDLSEYGKYIQYPGDVIVIVDVDGHPGCQTGECACCGDQYINRSGSFSTSARKNITVQWARGSDASYPPLPARRLKKVTMDGAEQELRTLRTLFFKTSKKMVEGNGSYGSGYSGVHLRFSADFLPMAEK